MKKNIEYILLSTLLGISVLLGLSFWLDIKFSFNIFYAQHWQELAKLQASNTPIDNLFYISIGIATFVFLFGLFLIFRQKIKKIFISNYAPPTETPITIPQQTLGPIPEPSVQTTRPPKLNLPKNITNIVAAKHAASTQIAHISNQTDTKKYDSVLSEIFSQNGYLVKQNPKISGLTTNLFAIGTNEQLWFGCTDCDPEKFAKSVEKLNSVFMETLEDIKININAFILNTSNLYHYDDSMPVFKSVDEIREFISQNPNPPTETQTEQDNFDAYSEYIDTIIQYIRNL